MKINIFIFYIMSFFCIFNVALAEIHDVIISAESMYLVNEVKSIQVGDTLKWINQDNKPHRIRSASGIFMDSGLLNPGVNFEYEIKRQTALTSKDSFFHLTFVDVHEDGNEDLNKELTILIHNEFVIIYPRNSWFVQQLPITMYIFQGYISLGDSLVVLDPLTKLEEASLDGNMFFNKNNSNQSFSQLPGVTFIGIINQNIGAEFSSRGYQVHVVNVEKNILPVGVHTLTVKVKSTSTGVIYKDTVNFTVL